MKNIIFDWSGVVKDAVVGHLWIVNKTFKKHGLQPLSLEEFRENWEQPHRLFYQKYLPDIDLEQESRDYKEAILSDSYPKTKPFPGIVELIKTLKDRGDFLAVVSSDFPESVLKEIKEYGLENIFDEVVTDVHDKFESVSALVRKYNLTLDETCFIGDSTHEVDVAKKTGIQSIAVTWGFLTEERLKSANPDFLVKDVKELESILL